MIQQLPGIHFVLDAIYDVVASCFLVLSHLNLRSAIGATFSSIFCLHIILHAKRVFGSSTVRWVMAKLPLPSSSFFIMYLPSITFRVGPEARCCMLAVFYISLQSNDSSLT